MSKMIAVLGVVTAVAFAVAPQFDLIQPQVAPWLMLVGTAAAAVAGALTKYGQAHPSVALTGVGIAIASVVAGAADMLPIQVVQVAAIVGTALAALGRSVFPVFAADKQEEDSE